MSGIRAVLVLLSLAASVIGWVFGRRPEEDAASGPTERLGIRYREIAEGRPPSGVGCLLVAAIPVLMIVGFIPAVMVGSTLNAVTGYQDPTPAVVTVAGLGTWFAATFGGSVWLVRNARRPGRIDPSLIMTVIIALDLGLVVTFIILARS
jgi:type IV secretory pathway TrbD component